MDPDKENTFPIFSCLAWCDLFLAWPISQFLAPFFSSGNDHIGFEELMYFYIFINLFLLNTLIFSIIAKRRRESPKVLFKSAMFFCFLGLGFTVWIGIQAVF